LHYNRFRYYDPETGRFISKDPIRYQGGLNLHVYAPSPVQWIDPLGLQVIFDCKTKRRRDTATGRFVSCQSITTPHGTATQSWDEASLAARVQVQNGATVYRTGTLGKSQTAEAQFWSLENPNTPGFAQRYGIPANNVTNANFIEAATVKPGTPFITRPAPGVGSNAGGGIEVVVPSEGVNMRWFSTM
jgi:uncharacterized protein RhaS with RHS repeats